MPQWGIDFTFLIIETMAKFPFLIDGGICKSDHGLGNIEVDLPRWRAQQEGTLKGVI